MLDVARLDQGVFAVDLAPLDLVALIGEVVATMSTPDRPVELRAAEEVIVAADAARVRQCVENLLANAVQHAPSGTAVKVTVSVEDYLGQSWATILVSDEGPGIAPELLPRLFERFARSSSSAGLGIGLYLAREIAEAHRGTLEVTSSPGAGTQFRLSIPAEASHLR
jgi:signal transduction histidine kinase